MMDEQTRKTKEDILQRDIELLKEENDKMKMLLSQINFEKSGFMFICGVGGERDKNGLPDVISVCPTFGVDWSVTYERRNK